MNICRMMYDQLNNWLNNKPQHGDVAYLIEPITDKRYIYVYRGPDNDPYSHLISDQFAADWFIKEADKLKAEEPKMEKRCDNSMIDAMKAEEVVPARYGTWRLETDEEEPNPMFKFVVCSACNEKSNTKYKYCPHCGAKMN